jgi:iron complex outermembrane receptor protein
MRYLQLIALVGFGVVFPLDAHAQPPSPVVPQIAAQDLKRLSIEELAELDVTSVSRRVEPLARTAAAVSVVRQEDLQRLGVTTLAEAMRLADGIDVARSDGRTWNVTARGFNIVTANKLLILMDGRTLYSPLFAGTFWDVHDTVMADIERIEVIRGPGGTMWGANAMNGVLNIITKRAADTRGTHLLLASGTENHVIASARHGGSLRGGGDYRVFGKFRRQGANVFASGTPAEDPLQLGQLGFRLDSDQADRTTWALQGNAYRGTEALFDREDTDVRGAFVQGQWSRRFSSTSELQVRSHYGHVYRNVPLQFQESRHTMDVDAQHRTTFGARHDVVGGAQVLVTTARDIGAAGFVFEPERKTNYVTSLFIQDEIAVRPDRLFLTIGSKFEGNDYTGLEVQPAVRIRWSPQPRQTAWGAISRAVRLPTRLDTDLLIRSQPAVTGSEDFEAESVVAYEAGYRLRPHPHVSVDVAAFVNDYDSLRSQEFPSRLGQVVELRNTLNALASGVELGGTLQALPGWRLHGSYSYFHKEFTLDPGSRDISRGVNEGNDPAYFFSVRSYLDLPGGLMLDGFFRRVARRPMPTVPAYSSLDVRLGRVVRPGWEISVVGQNLLEPRHPEFGAPGPRRYEFERGVYVRSIWNF